MFGYAIAGLGLLLAVSAGVNALQYRNHESYVQTASASVAALESAKKTQDATIVHLREVQEQSQRNMLELSGELALIQERYDESRLLIDTFRNRLFPAAIKRPTLIERYANRKWNAGMFEFERATGKHLSREHPDNASSNASPVDGD